MIATTDAVGTLPMAFSTSNGAEVRTPLATVVIGGIITSSNLTLMDLSSIYKSLTRQKIQSWKRETRNDS